MKNKRARVDELYVSIGKKIKQYRYEQGLSRDNLASKINVTHQQFTKYENGNNRIDLSKLLTLCKVLDKSLFDFIEVDNKVETDNLSRIDLEIIRNLSSIKNIELKSIINRLIVSIGKSNGTKSNN